jgi:hypothetical protein
MHAKNENGIFKLSRKKIDNEYYNINPKESINLIKTEISKKV